MHPQCAFTRRFCRRVKADHIGQGLAAVAASRVIGKRVEVKVITGLILLVVGLVAVGCGDEAAEVEPVAKDPVVVLTSVYPIEYFANRIGGDRVTVENLVPVGAEAHSFEPTPRDLQKLTQANLIAMNGLELELWLERAIEKLGSELLGGIPPFC